jgi:hypothetical protein
MPDSDDTRPTFRQRQDGVTMVVQVDTLGLAYTAVNRDEVTGVVTVDIGQAGNRVRFSDDPAVLLVIFSDAVAAIEAIGAGGQ